MKSPVVLVLGGGNSPEREVSLRSADNVIQALKKAGYEVRTADPKRSKEKLAQAIKNCDVILPILHGKGGEDGEIQKVLEKAKKPYLGSDSKVSRLCFDKHATRVKLTAANIKVAEGKIVNTTEFASFHKKHPKYVLKPIRGGSSIDTVIVRDPGQEDIKKLDSYFKKYKTMLVEELVDGLELTVPILEGVALPPIAIIPPSGEEFDYVNKYNGNTQEICPIPTDMLNEGLQNESMRLAEQVHRVVGARHLSRIDMIVRPDNTIVILEINTIPGLTTKSLFPKSALATGLPFEQLVTKLVNVVSNS